MNSIKAAFILVFCFITLGPSYADGHKVSKFIKKESAHSVSATLDKLEEILKKKGITVFARIDHASGAKKVGLELNPTQLLIFGNPKLGTPLMQTNQMIGLDLPMKALVWKDSAGKVWLAYSSPTYMKSKFGIQDKDEIFKKMTGALGKLTDAATK